MNRFTLLCLSALLLISPLPVLASALTLSDCLAFAAARNRGLKAKSYDEAIALQNVTMANSSWFPRIDFQGGYTAQLAEQKISFNNVQIPTQDADFGFFNLTLNYILYDFGRREARGATAVLLRESASDQYQGQEKDLFLQVIQAYYGVLRSGKLLLVAEDEVTRLMDHLRVAQHLYEQGVVTRNDVLQAEVRLAAGRQKKLAAGNDLDKAWLMLNYLTGQPETVRDDLEETLSDTAPGPVDDEAIIRRPEYRSQSRALKASDFDVMESRRAFYPEIFVRAGIDYMENSMVREQAIYGATIGAKVNLFEGNAGTARLRQAVARRSQNEARLNDLAAQLRLELALAARDAVVSKERIGVTEQAIGQAEENLRINKNRYLEHVGTATELLDAQTLLTQTKTDHYSAVYEYQVALARVRKARGEL